MTKFKSPVPLKLLSLCLLSWITLIRCNREKEPAVTSVAAQTYLDEVVGLMKSNSINRKTIDWTVFKAKVDAQARGAQTIADTYPAIQLGLTLLGDNHSMYYATTGTTIYGNRTVSCTDITPLTGTIYKGIGYVKVTTFNGGGSDATKFAQAIQDAIKAADGDSIIGWIVDLRGNLGGNMWPMVAGVGPLLGEGVCGYFIDPDGNASPWSYQGGSSSLSNAEITKVGSVYTVRKAGSKVAVLTDQATASSGEAVAIAFKGRPNTRSFGKATCGLSTANVTNKLSDGALLNLSQSTMANRSKQAYGSSVPVDEVVAADKVMAEATSWLLQ
ncbi:S41 family peptidase [Spirosoma sp. KNUC1025]|uniref:S41 family peptidase n=1 Tax=Spirosoma sp. KNUC1025 TaxID=2894082 RepID=UPI001E305885|nr:S41 family peptidase [Spirosoma sp. KNUC1025]UFH57605.1 S41 family peptidase [Spirosoma sp. KNUC1025]